MSSVSIHKNWWQALVLLIGVAELALLLYVFLVVPDTVSEHRMVSMNLVQLPYYRIGVTTLVAVQLIIVLAYMRRFIWVDSIGVSVAVILVCVAFLGWVMAVAFAPNTREHLSGAAIFTAFTAAYTVELLSMALAFEPAARLSYDLYCVTVYVFVAGFTASFVMLYFLDPSVMWVWENLAFILTVAGHTIFFWFHPFDPLGQPIPAEEKDGGDEELQAAPLITPFSGT